MLPILLLLLSVLLPSSHALDFCVGDLKGPRTPSGYNCKDPSTVTVDDFVFTGLAKRGNTSASITKAAVTFAFVDQFPGLNGLGISAARLDLAPGGTIPLHTHPLASEILVVIEGSLVAGLIASDNTAYYKTLNVGETIVFPRGLLHFQVNTGRKNAVALVSLANEDPGLQVTSTSSFGNDLPTPLIATATFIDQVEVKKLKALLGGTN